jgi:hypothetical protein
MTPDDQTEPAPPRQAAPRPVPAGADAEHRTLTTEEFRQLDTMLGGQDFPTLIRSGGETPAPRRAGLLQTLIVTVILAAIVALALYLFP